MNTLVKMHHLGVGKVFHGRKTPKEHSFSMNVYMLWVCLNDSPDKVRLGTLSYFEPSDYWMKTANTVSDFQQAIIAEWHKRGLSVNSVCVLSNPRTLNTKMNPLSVFYCYKDGELVAMIAEVTNTPWGERHHYFLVIDNGKNDHVECTAKAKLNNDKTKVTFNFIKDMHVSPFNPMSMGYEMKFYTTPEKVSVVMHLSKDEKPVFDAVLHLKTTPLTQSSWRKSFWKQPWITMQVRLRIYFEALRLKIKGVPFYSHPRKS